MNDLQSEIIIDILSRLPVDSVLQCKRICRTWRFLIDHDPTFLALHTHRFITSSSSSSSLSSSSSGGQLVIKSAAPAAAAAAAAFSFFMLVSRYSLYSIYDKDELYFGEYCNNINDAGEKNNYINNNNPAPLMKLSNKSIPISYHFHSLLNVDNNKCISSCNGLILIASISCDKYNNNNNNSDDADIFVFNPVTREYVHLPRPPPPFDKYNHEDGGGLGFGYHPITNEYKVVRITSSSSDDDDSESSDGISVYTLGSGGGIWRKSKGETKTNNLGGGGGGRNNNICHLRWDAHPAVLLNGVLHWPRNEYGYGVILSFDLADEELKIVPLPPQDDSFLWEPHYINHIHLGVLGGCLCLSANIGHYNQSRVDIWVLNKLEEDDHNQEYFTTATTASCSWTKKYSLSTGAARHHLEKYEIVADLGGGKILFSRFHDGRRLGLVLYDPETDYLQGLDEKRCFGTGSSSNRWSTINRWSAMIPYMKSFVSLKELGEVVL